MKYFIILVCCFPFYCFGQGQAYYVPVKKVSVNAKPATNDTLVASSLDIWQEKSKKAGYCYLYIENTTGYFVDLWIEEIYLGRLSPYSGVLRFDAQSAAWNKWYAKTAGGKFLWSNTSYCNDARFFSLQDKK